MLTLYQAEWCPYSSAVRQRLTELGIPFVAQPVEPQRAQRTALRRASGADEIPTLVADDGEAVVGTEAIFAWLAGRGGEFEHEHRERYAEHRGEREEETTARVLARHVPL